MGTGFRRAKICISLIQYLPIRRREKILFVQNSMQVGSEAPHSFAVAPALCAERISRRDKQAMS